MNNLEEILGELTSRQCADKLNQIILLDDSLTLKEVKNFLRKRMSKALREEEAQQAERDVATINKYMNKCLRVKQSDKYIAILNIKEVSIDPKYMRDAFLKGEVITMYDGKLEYKDKIDNHADNYFYRQECTEFPIEKFEELKKSIVSLKEQF